MRPTRTLNIHPQSNVCNHREHQSGRFSLAGGHEAVLSAGLTSFLGASFFLLNFNPQFFTFFNKVKSSILTFPTSKEKKGVNIFQEHLPSLSQKCWRVLWTVGKARAGSQLDTSSHLALPLTSEVVLAGQATFPCATLFSHQ